MPQNVVAAIAASIDGRTHNVFHRQTQLENLCKAVQREAAAIRDAIVSDGKATSLEATVEYLACVKCIKDAYYSISPSTALELEYNVAHGKNSPDNRVPIGIVYIEPQTSHTPFYSILAPLSSAIAAGNCVVVFLERNLRSSGSLLRTLLEQSLEKDTVAVVDERLGDELPPTSTVRVNQSSDEQSPSMDVLASPSDMPVVAIVDRTADVQSAAKEIVAARFSFGGMSPYAPVLVLVNEFVQQDFLHAVVHESMNYSRTPNGTKMNGKISKTAESGVTKALEQLRKADSKIRVVVQEDSLSVVELPSRKSINLSRLECPILAVHSIRSMDDAIELINAKVPGRCAAAYHFANSETGKYLSQFIPAEISAINYIPRQLLLGPTYPLGHPIDLDTRYPQALFSRNSPQYIKPTDYGARLASAMFEMGKDVSPKLLSEANEPLSVQKRGSGKGIGFFEQGLLLNFSLILFGSITASVAGVYYLRKLMR
jgi:acyl-CoA reductase-like NAD-dependent aldehyde dehydrogenase